MHKRTLLTISGALLATSCLVGPALAADNHTTTNSPSATNNAPVTTTFTVVEPAAGTPPAIATGIGNFVGTQSGGAAAVGSISQSINLSDISGLNTNTVDVTGDISAKNGNSGSAPVKATTITTTGPNTIGNGIGNTIGATATGASAAASVSQSILNSDLAPASTLGTNTVNVKNGSVTATNGANGPVTATMKVDHSSNLSPAGGGGIGNTIGASATGASAGAGIVQSLLSDPTGHASDLTVLPDNKVTVKSTAANAVSAKNDGNVTAKFTATAGHVQAVISTGGGNRGIGNWIGAQAIGASAGASISSSFENLQTAGSAGGSPAKNSVDTTVGGNPGDLSATNSGKVTATMGSGTPLERFATINGVNNKIGATAIGASAGASISQSVDNSAIATTPVDLTTLFANSVKTGDISSTNTGVVSASIAGGGSQVGLGVNELAIGNSVAAQAVGASSSASISQNVVATLFSLSSLSPGATNKITAGDISATNKEKVGATASFSSATTNQGVNTFNGASAGGASANASISQSIEDGGSVGSLLTTLPANSITAVDLTSSNTAAVTAKLTTTGDAVLNSSGASLLDSSVGNSLSAQAFGASSSASVGSVISRLRNMISGGSVSTNDVTSGDLKSTNSATGTVKATTSIGGLASIGGGVGNNLGASATGASSVASINQVAAADFMNVPTAGNLVSTIPSNSVTAGSVTATNSGAVTSTLSVAGPSSIAGGIGNSIAATATGASAGSSVSQTFAGITTLH